MAHRFYTNVLIYFTDLSFIKDATEPRNAPTKSRYHVKTDIEYPLYVKRRVKRTFGYVYGSVSVAVHYSVEMGLSDLHVDSI